jgi:hypothetical protein
MIKRLSLFALLLLLVLFSTQAYAGYTVGNVVNGGSLTGRVVFKGEIPPQARAPVTSDQGVCGRGYRKMKNLVISPGRGVLNAVVTLEGVTEGKAFSRAVQLIDQHDCAFLPHVQLALKGQEFVILNSDPVHHNIHGFLKERTIFNLAQPLMGKRIPVVLNRTGIIEVKCDLHPWMQAWIYVVEHPYYSVTGTEGEYLIDQIPPGTYRLKVWQEMMGVMEREVTIKPGQTLNIDLVYKATVE